MSSGTVVPKGVAGLINVRLYGGCTFLIPFSEFSIRELEIIVFKVLLNTGEVLFKT